MAEETIVDAVETNNTDDNTEKKIDKSIPYDRFKEVNEKMKQEREEKLAIKAKLEAYEEAERKAKEDKLLEEKKYDELLKAKETEVETYKQEKESLKRNMLLERVNNKIISIAAKEGAIDGEDILRFIKVDDLTELESDKLNEEINKKISELKNNKAHLFTTLQRDSRENGMPYSVNANNTRPSKPKTKEEAVLEALNFGRK